MNITQGVGEVKEIKVFESFSPQRQNWFYLHLQLEGVSKEKERIWHWNAGPTGF